MIWGTPSSTVLGALRNVKCYAAQSLSDKIDEFIVNTPPDAVTEVIIECSFGRSISFCSMPGGRVAAGLKREHTARSEKPRLMWAARKVEHEDDEWTDGGAEMMLGANRWRA